MDRISCLECGRCNRKGKPSVARFSKYCDSHYKRTEQIKRMPFISTLTSVKDRIFNKRLNKEGKLKTTKGFRRSWFERMIFEEEKKK